MRLERTQGNKMSEVKICPNCGASLEDFHRTGLLGCAVCYSVFYEEILPAIRHIQGGKTQHTGRSPAAEAGNKYALVIEQDQLYDGIAQAYREGRYADAEKMQRRLDEIAKVLHPKEDFS